MGKDGDSKDLITRVVFARAHDVSLGGSSTSKGAEENSENTNALHSVSFRNYVRAQDFAAEQ